MDLQIKLIWDLPLDNKTFEEIGRAIYYIASSVREMHLTYADAEGMEFLVKTDDENTLRDDINKLNREIKRVSIEAQR